MVVVCFHTFSKYLLFFGVWLIFGDTPEATGDDTYKINKVDVQVADTIFVQNYSVILKRWTEFLFCLMM